LHLGVALVREYGVPEGRAYGAFTYIRRDRWENTPYIRRKLAPVRGAYPAWMLD
jgi:hypothetical protein